ncbi:MAG: hypothetical protein GWN99_15585 [Gemmatimonadetes bacterium]|uniref:Uncharacterized protein n=1 Tax=Candidatus Kutchimonas denitrificans TaxID=3056748 RepID=A0AAE5C7R1_9BACT|nr:hypothetical protein [Gemmatimonadota bacterium]NIR73726.1 hypothetical protein [Candidatus Kutchimonas denitrificans]NIS02466.1 hypothetical protein [Gemmatimonadota bacterium]NIT67456.1 hypothetical protein [Gemmatimonadota bacterium]NIU51588.1 hypothetical protein [Gemmatimonadota bacterium]
MLKARIRGRFWKYLQFERYLHLYHFTPLTVEMALNTAGFEIAGWPARGRPMILVAVAP